MMLPWPHEYGFVLCRIFVLWYYYTLDHRSWCGGMLDSLSPSVCLSICPSVCIRHGFRRVNQACFGISIWNFICMFFVVMDRSLYIYSDVTFKMAAWQRYRIFRSPDSNFSLALNNKSKLHWHITCVHGKKPDDFQQCHFQNGCLVAILDFSVSGLCRWHGFRSITRVCFGISIEITYACSLWLWTEAYIFSAVLLSKWRPYWNFQFPDSKFSLTLNIKSKLQLQITCVYGKKLIDFQQCRFQNGRLATIFEF